MPSDLDQLAQDADHQDRWGAPMTGNGLQDLATRGLPPPQPAPAAFTRAQEHQQQWAMPPTGTQLQNIAHKTFIDMPRDYLEHFGHRVQEAMTDEDPYTRAYSGAELGKEFIIGGYGAAPKGALGIAGGRGFIIKPESRAYFNSSIGKTIPEPEFLQRYWAGYDNPNRPNVALTYFQDEKDLGHRISVSGNLVKNGQIAGTMQRVIKPEEGYSYHAGLHIDPDFRRQGIAKNIYRNQRDVYRQIGVNRVGILADEDGAHVWGNFGYKPLTSEWIRNRHMYMDRVNRLSWMSKTGQSEITPADLEYMKRIINSDDPRGHWLLSDLDIPLVVSRRDEDGIMRMEESTAGREVLRDLPWNGEMNYKDPEQVRRQNDFLK